MYALSDIDGRSLHDHNDRHGNRHCVRSVVVLVVVGMVVVGGGMTDFYHFLRVWV